MSCAPAYTAAMPVYETASEQETAKLAAETARTLTTGDVLTLSGPLGAGKSVFARALIRTLCGAEIEVPSPTFTLVQTYETPQGALYHFDLYRLQSPDELFELGWEDARGGVALVEWPEKAAIYMPGSARRITLTPAGAMRRIEIND